jgi:hypothetical protein
VPPALLSALRASESSQGGPCIVPQTDRRQHEGRRSDWRGGRRVSDFARFTGLTWVDSSSRDGGERHPSTAEGFLH